MSKLSTFNVEPIPYNKEMVEHLTDQLIKLQKAYDSTKEITTRVELDKGMKTINKALEGAFSPRFIVSHDGAK